MGGLEKFGQNEERPFEMPQSALGVEEKLRDYQVELESSGYEDLSVEDKHKALNKIEEELELIDSGLSGIFVNPREDRDYSNLKELIVERQKLIFKKRKPLLH
ncbi:MAG: hypothetical protein AAB507_01935 [Patescibacteria group bacterium]